MPQRIRRPTNVTLAPASLAAGGEVADRLGVPFGRLLDTALRAELARQGVELLELTGTDAAIDRLIRDARQWPRAEPQKRTSCPSKPALPPELAPKASAAAALLSKIELGALRTAEMSIEDVLARIAAKPSTAADLQKVWRGGQYGYATIYLAALARARVIRMDKESKRWTLIAPAAAPRPFTVPMGARVVNALPPPVGTPRGAAPPSRRRPRTSTSSR